MKIKTWQKWFICCFVAIFVAIYFVYDAMFFSTDDNFFADEIVIEEEIEVEEELPSTEETEKEETSTEEQEPVEAIPAYTNGYNCLIDAYDRMQNITSFKLVQTGKCVSAGQVQNVKCIKQKCGNKYSVENFGYSDVSFARTFYERLTVEDENYKYWYTEDVNSSFEYNIDLNDYRNFNSKEETYEVVSTNVYNIFSMTPTKNNGKLLGFDRISNKDYYIITFSFNIEDIPKIITDEMKKHSGATSIEHSSFMLEAYISKETGLIKRYTHKEVYSITVMGITLNVQSQLSATLSNINKEFTFTY